MLFKVVKCRVFPHVFPVQCILLVFIAAMLVESNKILLFYQLMNDGLTLAFFNFLIHVNDFKPRQSGTTFAHHTVIRIISPQYSIWFSIFEGNPEYWGKKPLVRLNEADIQS